jgi:Tol biopolymer transport system component
VAGPGEEVPIRLIDTVRNREQKVTTMFALGSVNPSVLRLDPHPAWSRDGRKICFNGAPDGRRQVFVADLASLLG